MSSQVQELIDKIQSEGVETGQQKAQEIEAQAKTDAQKILDDAKRQADQMIAEAKQETKKMQESTQMALKQASRDVILSLKKEIQNTLQKIVLTEVHDALKAEELTAIITTIVKSFVESKTLDQGVEVVLSDKDLKKLKEGLVAKLKKQLKGSIKIQSSDDVGAGFTISFDSGKSNFDFTDKSLAEYLGIYLNQQVAELLKG